MERLLKDLQNHPQGWPFLNPVSPEDVSDYYEVIKYPMGALLSTFTWCHYLAALCQLDFRTMEHKLETKEYSSLDDFIKDTRLVFDNCRMYNPEGSIYVRNANKLEKHLKDLLAEKLKREDRKSVV